VSRRTSFVMTRAPSHMREYVASSRPRRAVTRSEGRPLIDRRTFLKAAIVAAGSALASSLIGCDSAGFPIPCLGPAPPPTPVPGMTYIRASEIGCALDCDLSTGRNKHTGGSATDDGPRINTAMAAATANNPITLIIDGSALISGLFLPAGGYWNIAGLGCGTGFFVKTGTNNDGIHNGPPNAAIPFDPGPPAPARGANVSLRNFTVNGNQGDGHDGNSTSGERPGITGKAWYCGINLMNLNNITIENVVVVNTPAYHIRLSNVGKVRASGCVMKSYGFFTDGLHFDGPANDIRISNCNFTCGDDSIALNCPEGYTGNISRVTVDNCTFDSFSLMRLYTANRGTDNFNIDSVSVSNCSGKLAEVAFVIGLAGSGDPNSIASLTVSDCSLSAPTLLGIAENFGNITLKNVSLNPWQSEVVWVAPQSNRICAFLRPSPLYGNISFVGSNLSFENCQICRYGNVSVAAVILENDSTIGSVTFNGFAMQEAGSPTPVPALLGIGSGSIGSLVLNSLSSDNILTPVSGEFSSVGVVSGTGVLATGWEFPNDVMANGVPYISASTGLPSIKVGGVVEAYTG
jgi:Glycosyl hydrolases family 28